VIVAPIKMLAVMRINALVDVDCVCEIKPIVDMFSLLMNIYLAKYSRQKRDSALKGVKNKIPTS
jgi:hypothetical protein